MRSETPAGLRRSVFSGRRRKARAGASSRALRRRTAPGARRRGRREAKIPSLPRQVAEKIERKGDIGGNRGPSQDRRPTKRDGDRARENILGVLARLEHEPVLEHGRELEGVTLVRARHTEAGQVSRRGVGRLSPGRWGTQACGTPSW